jgi:hypothetical protein
MVKTCDMVCCCPRLKPEDYDRKVFEWVDKPFYKTTYFSFVRVPLTYKSTVNNAMTILKSKNLAADPMLVLSGEETLFYSTLLLEMKKDDRSLPVRRVTGRFVSMLFHGSLTETNKWIKTIVDYCNAEGRPAKELYFFYATCPKCAEHYGTSQVVIFAKVK